MINRSVGVAPAEASIAEVTAPPRADRHRSRSGDPMLLRIRARAHERERESDGVLRSSRAERAAARGIESSVQLTSLLLNRVHPGRGGGVCGQVMEMVVYVRGERASRERCDRKRNGAWRAWALSELQ